MNLDENNTKRNRISTKIYTDIDHEKNQLAGNTITKKSEQKARDAMDNEYKIEAKKIIDKELKRTNRSVLNLNTVFSAENVKVISDQAHHSRKYSDYESDDLVHYPPGRNLNYYSD